MALPPYIAPEGIDPATGFPLALVAPSRSDLRMELFRAKQEWANSPYGDNPVALATIRRLTAVLAR